MHFTRAPESIRASRVKSWKSMGAKSIFFFFLRDTAEKIGMQFVMGSDTAKICYGVSREVFRNLGQGVGLVFVLGWCVVYNTGGGSRLCISCGRVEGSRVLDFVSGLPTGERGGNVDFSDWTFVVPQIFCSLLGGGG